jgi:integrase
MSNRRPAAGLSPSRPSSRQGCAGIWTDSQRRGIGASSSSARKGATLRRSSFRPIWNAATESAGIPGLHFHDLRHVGGTLAAATGASLKELMARLGHSSTRAAMICQHATRDRDEAIAKALGGLLIGREGR